MVSKYFILNTKFWVSILIDSTTCPKAYPYAYDITDFRDHCCDSVWWDFEHPLVAPEVPEYDENGNEIRFKDRPNVCEESMGAKSMKCPHFPIPCTDAAGKLHLGCNQFVIFVNVVIILYLLRWVHYLNASILVAQCMTVKGSLAGYADDFGRTYQSVTDAIERCKEGIKHWFRSVLGNII